MVCACPGEEGEVVGEVGSPAGRLCVWGVGGGALDPQPNPTELCRPSGKAFLEQKAEQKALLLTSCWSPSS